MYGEGPLEIDAVIDIVCAHRDSDGQHTVARRIAFRLFEYFAHAAPTSAIVDELVVASGFASAWSIAALVRAILVHDAFYATATPAPFDAGTPKSVKWPVDFMVSTLRLLRVKVKRSRSRGLRLEAGGRSRLRSHLSNMGQDLLDPPSVFGWEWETAWLSSATLLARYRFARDATAVPDEGRPLFRPEKLIDIALTDAAAIVAAVTGLLGVVDQLTGEERAILIDYLSDGGAHATIDLRDPAVRELKLNGLFTLVLQSPAYQLH